MGRFVLAIVAAFGAAIVLGLGYWMLLVLFQPLLDRMRLLFDRRPAMPKHPTVAPVAAVRMSGPELSARRRALLLTSKEGRPLTEWATHDIGMSHTHLILKDVVLESPGDLLFAEYGHSDLKEPNALFTFSHLQVAEAECFLRGTPAPLGMREAQLQFRRFGQSSADWGLKPKVVFLTPDAAERKLMDKLSKDRTGVSGVGALGKKAWQSPVLGDSTETFFEKGSPRMTLPRFAN